MPSCIDLFLTGKKNPHESLFSYTLTYPVLFLCILFSINILLSIFPDLEPQHKENAKDSRFYSGCLQIERSYNSCHTSFTC
jgi:hypothetical protein